jgi:hypothetical protein
MVPRGAAPAAGLQEARSDGRSSGRPRWHRCRPGVPLGWPRRPHPWLQVPIRPLWAAASMREKQKGGGQHGTRAVGASAGPSSAPDQAVWVLKSCRFLALPSPIPGIWLTRVPESTATSMGLRADQQPMCISILPAQALGFLRPVEVAACSPRLFSKHRYFQEMRQTWGERPLHSPAKDLSPAPVGRPLPWLKSAEMLTRNMPPYASWTTLFPKPSPAPWGPGTHSPGLAQGKDQNDFFLF